MDYGKIIDEMSEAMNKYDSFYDYLLSDYDQNLDEFLEKSSMIFDSISAVLSIEKIGKMPENGYEKDEVKSVLDTYREYKELKVTLNTSDNKQKVQSDMDKCLCFLSEYGLPVSFEEFKSEIINRIGLKTPLRKH